MHSGMRLRSQSQLRVMDLAVVEQMLREMIDDWGEVQSLVLEEISMWPPQWLYALIMRLAIVREGTHGSNRRYPWHKIFGGMALVHYLGDFFQLKPVRQPSLCERPRAGAAFETRNGQDLFNDTLTFVLTLQTPQGCPEGLRILGPLHTAVNLPYLPQGPHRDLRGSQ